MCVDMYILGVQGSLMRYDMSAEKWTMILCVLGVGRIMEAILRKWRLCIILMSENPHETIGLIWIWNNN